MKRHSESGWGWVGWFKEQLPLPSLVSWCHVYPDEAPWTSLPPTDSRKQSIKLLQPLNIYGIDFQEKGYGLEGTFAFNSLIGDASLASSVSSLAWPSRGGTGLCLCKQTLTSQPFLFVYHLQETDLPCLPETSQQHLGVLTSAMQSHIEAWWKRPCIHTLASFLMVILFPRTLK